MKANGRDFIAHMSPASRLKHRLDRWGCKLRLSPRYVRVQHMTRKWGSCSNKGIVTLALDLADQHEGFQDFVMVHELLHLRVPNHGRLFKALMTVHVPDWREYDVYRKSLRHGERPERW